MALDPQKQLALIGTVAAQTAQMAQAYRRWAVADWQRATFCSGWTAADAVAHLATGGDFYAQVLRAGLHGEPGLPWGVTDRTGFRAARAAAAQKLLDAGPAGLIDGFVTGAAGLQEVFTALQAADFGKVAWHPRGLVPIGDWIGMRITELGMHDWDIRQPHEAEARLSPTVLPALLSALPTMQTQFLQQRLSQGMDGVYTLQAGDSGWGFTVRDQNVTFQAQAPATCDAGLQADAARFILLTMGRANLEANLQRGTLQITGDRAKGLQLGATLFRPL